MLIYAIILGLIQGITEFLPISSSGHLILLPRVFGFADQGLAVDAFLHLASALAIFVYFRQDWWKIVTRFKKDDALRKIIIASVPAILAGLIFGGLIESYLRSSWVVVVMLVLVAVAMWWVEQNYVEVKMISGKENKQIIGIDGLDTLIIGLFQTLALIPGTSRSGITITAGMWRSISREQAARFSFLLGAPITLGAGLLKLTDLASSTQTDWGFISLAASITFVTAMASMHWLLRFLRTNSLKSFAIYRVVLAVIVAVLLII